MPISRQYAGLAVSAALHGALVTAVVLELDIFGAEDPPQVEFVEAQIISAEELADIAAAPEPTPPESLASVEPPPEPEAAPGPAPYEAAPEAPNPLVFDPQAASDAPVEDKIREALPKPRVRQPAPAPEPPKSAEATPSVDRSSAEPPPVEEPAPSPKPRIANAPSKPQAQVRDRAPKPDQPDTPPAKTAEAPTPEPKPEPKPEAVASAAPESAPAPRPRPTRVAKAAPTPKPEPAAKPAPKPADRRAERAAAPAVGPPLSLAEKNGLRISLRRCWSRPDPAGVDPALLVVKLNLQLREDGRIIGRPRVLLPKRLTVFRQRAAVLAAQQAVARCQPYRLPPAKYSHWRQVNVTFDPRDDAPGVQ